MSSCVEEPLDSLLLRNHGPWQLITETIAEKTEKQNRVFFYTLNNLVVILMGTHSIVNHSCYYQNPLESHQHIHVTDVIP